MLSSSSTRFRSVCQLRCTSFSRAPTWWSRWAEMLVSSPSPSALRPSSSPSSRPPRSSSFSSPSFPRHPVASASSTAAVPTTAAPGYHHHPHQHYEPATHQTAASSGSPLSRRSSRVAIEELRSALTRHTVASTSSGPSGDLPGGRSAGLTTLGGGNSTYSSATPIPAVATLVNSHSSDRPTDTRNRTLPERVPHMP